jgi:hypothetical protein
VVGHTLQVQQPIFTIAKLYIGTQNLRCHLPSFSTYAQLTCTVKNLIQKFKSFLNLFLTLGGGGSSVT